MSTPSNVNTTTNDINQINVEQLGSLDVLNLGIEPSYNAKQPSLFFLDDPRTGIARVNKGSMSLVHKGIQRITIDGDGAYIPKSRFEKLYIDETNGSKQISIEYKDSNIIFGDQIGTFNNIVPYEDSTHSLGSLTNKWEYLYVDNIVSTGPVNFEQIIIDTTNTEALLVRKNNDGGDVFVVDTSSDRIGVGTSSPSTTVHAISTTEQLRLGYNDSNYSSFTVDNGGDLTVAPSGGDTNITGKCHVSGRVTMGTTSDFTPDLIMYGNPSGFGAMYFNMDNDFDNHRGIILYNFANDNLLFGTANSVKMTLDSNGDLGIGTTSPSARVHSLSTTEQLRLGYDGSNYASFTVDDSGELTVAPTGAETHLTGKFHVSDRFTMGDLSTTTSDMIIYSSTAGFGIIYFDDDDTDPNDPDNHQGSIRYLHSNDTMYFGTAGIIQMALNSNGDLGVGTSSPSTKVHSLSTTEQLRLGYDGSNYASFTTSPGGDLTIAPSGGNLSVTGNIAVTGTVDGVDISDILTQSGSINLAVIDSIAPSTSETTLGNAITVGGLADNDRFLKFRRAAGDAGVMFSSYDDDHFVLYNDDNVLKIAYSNAVTATYYTTPDISTDFTDVFTINETKAFFKTQLGFNDFLRGSFSGTEYWKLGTYDYGTFTDCDTQVWRTLNASFNFMYMKSNHISVGYASTAPNIFDIRDTDEQLRLSYDVSNYTSFETDAAGDLTITPSGGDTEITGTLGVKGADGIIVTIQTNDNLVSEDAILWFQTRAEIGYKGSGTLSSGSSLEVSSTKNIDILTTTATSLYLGTNSTLALTIDNAQDVTIPAGDLTVSAGDLDILTGSIQATHTDTTIASNTDYHSLEKIFTPTAAANTKTGTYLNSEFNSNNGAITTARGVHVKGRFDDASAGNNITTSDSIYIETYTEGTVGGTTLRGLYNYVNSTSTGTYSNIYAAYNGIDIANTTATSCYATYNVVSVGSGSNVGNSVGTFSISQNVGTANISSNYGEYIVTGNESSGTISYNYGLFIEDVSNSGGGTVTTNYGIYLESIDSGTTNYAIYTNAGAVRLGDDVTVVGDILTEDNTSSITCSATNDTSASKVSGINVKSQMSREAGFYILDESDTEYWHIGHKYTSGNDQTDLQFLGQGTLLMDLDQSGNLEVTGSITSTGLDVNGDLAVDTDTLFVDTSVEMVGIGTSSPLSLLHLDGSSGVYLNSKLTNASSRPSLSVTPIASEIRGYSNSGTTGNDGFLRLSAGGGTATTSQSYIDLTGYSTVSDMHDTIVMGTAGTERLRIDLNGDVTLSNDLGIGTTSNSTTDMRIYTTTTGTGRIFFYDDGDKGYISYNHSDNDMYFGTSGSTRMTINTSGNLGLGIINPGADLHIYRNAGIADVRVEGPDARILIKDTDTALSSSAPGVLECNLNFVDSSNSFIADIGYNSVPGIDNDGDGFFIRTRLHSDVLFYAGTNDDSKWSMFLSADDQSVNIHYDLIVDTNLLFVDSSENRVGILTSSPSDLLEVVATTNDIGIQITGADTSISPTFKFADAGGTVRSRIGIAGGSGELFSSALEDDLCIRSESDRILLGVGGGSSAIVIDSSNDVSITGSNLTVAGNMEIGDSNGDYQHLRIGGGNSSGYLYGCFSKYSDGIHMGYNFYNDNTFNQIPNSGGPTSRISMGYGYVGIYTGATNTEPTTLGYYQNSLGRVGINTTTPVSTLDVRGVFNWGDGTNGGSLSWGGSDNTYISSNAGKRLDFATNGSGTASMVITTAGNVGINNSSPSEALDVVGTVHVKSKIVFEENGGREFEFSYSATPEFITQSTTDAKNWRFLSPNNTQIAKIYFSDSGGGMVIGSNIDNPPAQGLLVGGDTSITGDLDVDTDTFFVDTTLNRVGIRTNSPSDTLHVLGGIFVDNDNARGLYLYTDGIAAIDPPYIHFRNDTTTADTVLALDDSDSKFIISSEAAYATATNQIMTFDLSTKDVSIPNGDLSVSGTLSFSSGDAMDYEEYSDAAIQFRYGAQDAKATTKIKLVRVGDQVTLYLSGFSVVSPTSATYFDIKTSGDYIPAAFRPDVTKVFLIRVIDNATYGAGTLNVTLSGNIEVYNTFAAFGNFTDGGSTVGLIGDLSVTYTLNDP